MSWKMLILLVTKYLCSSFNGLDNSTKEENFHLTQEEMLRTKLPKMIKNRWEMRVGSTSFLKLSRMRRTYKMMLLIMMPTHSSLNIQEK